MQFDFDWGRRAQNKTRETLTEKELALRADAAAVERQRRAEKRRLGLCTEGACRELATRGWYCVAHAEKRSVYSKNRKRRLVMKGNCAYGCGKKAVSKWYCEDHLGKRGKWALKERYGISAEDFDAMVTSQKGRCAICNLTKVLVVDHCHATGVVRDLLCRACNNAIGLLKDQPFIIRVASNYVARHAARQKGVA